MVDMLFFMASVLDQMDRALEQVLDGSVHDARFGLMLTDNAVELVLHQIATDRASRLKQFAFMREKYEHQEALDEARGARFEPKLRFARLEGAATPELAQTIGILHGFRNEVYHVGLRNEAILPELASLYFDTACRVFSTWQPYGLWWSSSQELPERARKYFPRHDTFFPGDVGDFHKACGTLMDRCGHDPARTIAALADQASQAVSDQDTNLDIVAGGIYDSQRRTRDQAIRNVQGWPLAFTAKGRQFAEAHGWHGDSFISLSDFLGTNYPVKFRADPIRSWRKRVEGIRRSTSAHLALSNYHSFMHGTATIREALEETAMQIEQEIDRLIDAAREGD